MTRRPRSVVWVVNARLPGGDRPVWIAIRDGQIADLWVLVPGARADLVLLDGDPLTDISSLERVRWTIREGVARTPREWIEAGVLGAASQ